MKNLDTLLDEWEVDSKIDNLDLSEESNKTGKLHSKYLRCRSTSSMKSRQIMNTYKERKAWKQSYFRGEFNNPEDLSKYNVKPWPGPFASIEVNNLIENDLELSEILLRKAHYDEMVAACDMILSELRNRTYAIGNSIKWNIFQSGG